MPRVGSATRFPDRFADFQIERSGSMGAYKPSSLIDWEAGRPVEVEAIWGEPLAARSRRRCADAIGSRRCIACSKCSRLRWLLTANIGCGTLPEPAPQTLRQSGRSSSAPGSERFVDAVEVVGSVPFSEVAGLPQSTVPGHAGRFVLGKLGAQRVLLAQGRVHLYEGPAGADGHRGRAPLCRDRGAAGDAHERGGHAPPGLCAGLVDDAARSPQSHGNFAAARRAKLHRPERGLFAARCRAQFAATAADAGHAAARRRLCRAARPAVRDAGGGAHAPHARRGCGRDVHGPGGDPGARARHGGRRVFLPDELGRRSAIAS